MSSAISPELWPAASAWELVHLVYTFAAERGKDIVLVSVCHTRRSELMHKTHNTLIWVWKRTEPHAFVTTIGISFCPQSVQALNLFPKTKNSSCQCFQALLYIPNLLRTNRSLFTIVPLETRHVFSANRGSLDTERILFDFKLNIGKGFVWPKFQAVSDTFPSVRNSQLPQRSIWFWQGSVAFAFFAKITQRQFCVQKHSSVLFFLRYMSANGMFPSN